MTGVIRSVGPANAILVELDHPEGCRQMYYDILRNDCYDVVSDACPSATDVSFQQNNCFNYANSINNNYNFNLFLFFNLFR